MVVPVKKGDVRIPLGADIDTEPERMILRDT